MRRRRPEIVDLYDDVAEWACDRRGLEQRGAELLIRARSQMGQDELLEALNDVVKDFHYDLYRPAEMRTMLAAAEALLEREAGRAAWLFTYIPEDDAGVA